MHQPEKPISSIKEDIFSREGFVERLMGALIADDKKSTGVVLGLTGKWGSGKSSILNMLEEKIESTYQEAVVVNFNPWLITDKKDLINQFFAELNACLGKNTFVRRLTHQQYYLPEALTSYAASLAPIADNVFPGAGIAVKTSVDVMAKAIRRDVSLHELRTEIDKELERVCFPIVVIIDELDRVEDDEVKTVAQLIKGIADFPNISYLVAYDEQRVIQALGSNSGYPFNASEMEERGRNYLEKIIQYNISLPKLGNKDLESLLLSSIEPIKDTHELKVQQWDKTEERLNKLLEISVPGLLSTPRDIKRVIGHFQVITGMVGGEVDWVDLLGMSIIQIKAPGTYRWIRENERKVVDTNRYFSSSLLNKELEKSMGIKRKN